MRCAAIAAVLLLAAAPIRAGDGAAHGSATGGADAGAELPTFAARLELVSRQLLGVPYLLGPLGEESPPDHDPRFRLDAFDCTTYVETALALALAGQDPASADAATARSWLDRVRYRDGVARYDARRHLIDAQWIPQLVGERLLRDVTRDVGGRATRTETLRLRREPWESSALGAGLGLDWSALPAGRHVLDYLPWDALRSDEVRRALPPLAVLSLVAAPERDVPTLVTHQGLLLRTPSGELVVRHASGRHRRTVEEPLDAFAERSRRRRGRTVLGVNVLVVEPGAWGVE